MHTVRFLRRGPGGTPTSSAVEVAPGSTLLDAARRAGLPVAQACGGQRLCGRCGLRVREGGEALSPETPAEADARRRNRVAAGTRLACSARVRGEVCATATYW